LRSRPSSSDPLLWPLARQLQAGSPPQPICSARAHAVAVAPEKDADAAITVARILRRQLSHPLDRGRVPGCFAILVAQRRSATLNRLAEIVNVKDYGAVADGSTDDTTAIQTAFNAAFGEDIAKPLEIIGYVNRKRLVHLAKTK
jgi:hypothetical protein